MVLLSYLFVLLNNLTIKGNEVIYRAVDCVSSERGVNSNTVKVVTDIKTASARSINRREDVLHSSRFFLKNYYPI